MIKENKMDGDQSIPADFSSLKTGSGDLLIYNARILSFQDGFDNNAYDTLAISGNRIKAIGRFGDLQSLIQPGTQVINALGKTLMPGLNDSHIHIWKVGNLKTYMLDVRGAQSLDHLLQMLADYALQYPEAAWITARGFNEAAWKNGQIPTKTDLDKVIKDRPVYVIRTCAHIAVCNSKALKLCNITANTPVPDGGVIYQGDDGKPNGIFSETALGLITKNIPPYTKTELKTMVLAAREELYKYGVTSATDPAVDPLLLDTYYEMHRENRLGFRLNAIPIILPDGGDQPYPIPDYYTSDEFNVNTVKFFSDGGLSGKTAALKRPYKNSAEQGVLRLNKDQYITLASQASAKGLSIATHAIGDAAIQFVIDSYKELKKLFPDIKNRIEHLGLPETKHLEAMHKYEIATSMQSIFISELGKNFIKYLDEDYLNRCYPVKSVIDNNILMALSSDAPVVKNLNPFKGVQAAVTRTDDEGSIIAAHEAITVAEALKAYTYNAALISKTEQTGSLAAGKFADFIVLDGDPLKISHEQLNTIKVKQTFVNGQSVYSA
ncbi:amidohydrolase [Mucilaginibacter celer]|uniref:Amidohydrolase n=1 Tax=Mucilaginibacter celer TaxID=2305508 RepID=A0A494VJN2_9SPHI|nr:amidohydrolase [Mucilaginibacter celer]AYL94484.1 amidohydrolase [Mucilaginibacter celer]